MGFINLILAVLAAWRITSAINREKIGQPIRAKLAKEREQALGMYSYGDGFLAELIMCFYCLSFWVSIFCTVSYLFFPIFLYPFAISSLVILVDKVYQHGSS